MAAPWQWENATAGAVAGFATVAAMHPLDVVRTRFQVNDGRGLTLPTYRNTAHAVFTIARLEAFHALTRGKENECDRANSIPLVRIITYSSKWAEPIKIFFSWAYA